MHNIFLMLIIVREKFEIKNCFIKKFIYLEGYFFPNIYIQSLDSTVYILIKKKKHYADITFIIF